MKCKCLIINVKSVSPHKSIKILILLIKLVIFNYNKMNYIVLNQVFDRSSRWFVSYKTIVAIIL